MSLGEFELNDQYAIRDVNASFAVEGERSNFDFDLSFDETKYLGLGTDKLRLTGYGTLVKKSSNESDEGERFEFESPIDLFRLSFHFVNLTGKDGKPQRTIDYKEHIFDFDGSKIKITKGPSD
jgi:hypothetical protein